MPKSVEGVYRNGKVELTGLPADVHDDTPVIVTFLETADIDLRERGIDETQAAERRGRLETVAEEWDREERAVYDTYDAAK
ncbi:MAG: hypothetical protein ABFE01_01620, partial [Phycisphaerales bacterium]